MMKQKFLLLLSFVALMVSSCEPSEVTPPGPGPEPDGDGVEISFDVDEIAGIIPGESITVAALDDESAVVSESKYTLSGTKLTSKNPIVKDSEKQELSYKLIYPALPSYTEEFTYTLEPDQNEGCDENLLCIGSVEATASATPAVSFAQKLTGIMFAAKLENGTVVVPTSAVVLTPGEAKYSFVDSSVTPEGTTVLVTPCNFTDKGYMATIVPQTVLMGKVFAEVEYDGNLYQASFAEETVLESGVQYEYRFILGADKKTATIELVKTNSDEWSDVLSEDDEPEVPTGEFSATLVQAKGTDILINVDKGAYDGNYYIGCVENAEWASSTDEEVATALMKYEIYTCNTDLTVVDNKFIYFEDGNVSVARGWKIEQFTDYRIVVFGLDGEGNFLTDVQGIAVNSGELVVTVEGSIEMSIEKVESDNITVTTVPSPEIKNYIYGMLSAKSFKDNYGSDKNRAAQFILDLYLSRNINIAQNNGFSVMRGVQTFGFDNVWVISPEVDYVLFVFGVHESGVISSEVTMDEVTTPAPDPIPDPTDDFAMSLVSTTATDIVVNVDKGSWPSRFYVGIMADFDGTPEELAEHLMDIESASSYTDFSVANNLQIFDNDGEISLDPGWVVVPSKEYMVVAFGLTVNGDVQTNVASVMATTKDMVYEGTIDLEFLDVTSSSVKARATPSAEVDNYIYCLQRTADIERTFKGDLMAVAYATVGLYNSVNFDYAGEADGVKVLNGVSEFNFNSIWTVKPNTEYTYLVFGVNPEGIVTSNLTSGTLTTPAALSAPARVEYYDYSRYMGLKAVSVVDAPRAAAVVEPRMKLDISGGVAPASKPAFVR